MSRSKQLFIARARVEPQDPKRELVSIFEAIMDNVKPSEGFKFEEPDLEKDTAAYLYFEPFSRKDWKIAKFVIERLIHKKILKPLGMQPASVTIEVRAVTEGQQYPKNWVVGLSLDELGNTKVEEPKR